MRTQTVYYAVHERTYNESCMKGVGFTDNARFIFHIRGKAFLFGKHEGRTLVVELFTSGFYLRFRLLQTKP